MAANLALMAASFAVNYLANRLAGEKDDATARDDKPTTVSTRGAYVPYLIGRRRVGVVFGWAGDRSTEKEAISGGGKGLSSSGEQTVYYEAGWHQVTCTPAHRLNKILKDGKEIFSGTLTPDSAPSGVAVDLGKPGIFTPYWGQPDQPVNAFLGDASRLGVASRWPFLTYFEWNKARLGTSARWALFDYDVECRPISALSGSSPWIEDSRSLSGKTDAVKTGTAGEIGTAKIVVNGDRSKRYKPGEYLKLTGNTAPDGDYLIFNSVYNPGTYPVVIDETTIYLGQPVVAMNNAGTIEKYDTMKDGGANPAHALSQILMQPHPLGIGIGVGTSVGSSQIQRVDVDSLERLGELFAEEGARCHVFANSGMEALSAIAAILQEFSVVAPIIGGKLTFVACRQEAVVPTIPADALLPPKPRRRALLGEQPVTHSVFKFSDAARDWRDNTITVDDDGKAVESNNPKARSVRLDTITHFDTAAACVERRAQEDQAGAGTVDLNVAREGALLYPGMSFDVDGFEDRLRCLEQASDLSGRTKVKATVDFIGAPISGTQVSETGEGFSGLEEVEADLLSWPVEVPEFLAGSGAVNVIVPRLRAHAQIAGADLWISGDNTSYVNKGQHLGLVAGGTLSTALAVAAEDYVLAQGPQFTALGPDIAQVLDLSADPTNWRLGRQLCVLVTAAGVVEICFLQKVTAIGGSTYRLDGLMRQRYDTTRTAFAIGDKVFIFEQTDVLSFQDALLSPGASLFAKTQPFTGESLPLSSVFPTNVTLRGKGITPMPLGQLINAAQDFGYTNISPGTITFHWQYRSHAVPGSGAGLQGAGTPTALAPAVGTFTLRIKNSGGTTIRTVTGLTTRTYDYTEAQFDADFPAGANSYKVSVEQVSGGLSSGQLEITMTKY